MDIETLKEIKNARGEIKTKVVQVTNKKPKKGLRFDTINELYNELLTKYKASDITITAKFLDGNYTTLKSSEHTGDNLRYTNENYFSSLPKDVQEKLSGVYYSVVITIKK